MRKVASEAGIGAMTIYNYFDSKSALLHHIWQEFFDELFVEMMESKARHDEPKAAVVALCESYLNYWTLHPDRFRMVFLNEDRADANNTFFVDHAGIEDKLTDLFGELLRTLLQNMRALDSEVILHSLFCQLNGICLNTITISEFEWKSAKEILNHYLDAVFD